MLVFMAFAQLVVCWSTRRSVDIPSSSNIWMRPLKIYGKVVGPNKQTSIHTRVHNAVTLVWASLRLAPTNICTNVCTLCNLLGPLQALLKVRLLLVLLDMLIKWTIVSKLCEVSRMIRVRIGTADSAQPGKVLLSHQRLFLMRGLSKERNWPLPVTTKVSPAT